MNTCPSCLSESEEAMCSNCGKNTAGVELDWEDLCCRLLACVYMAAETEPEMTIYEFAERCGELGPLSQEQCDVITRAYAVRVVRNIGQLFAP